VLGDQSPQQAAKKLPRGEPTNENQWLAKIRDLYYDPSGETVYGPYGKLLSKAKTLPEAKPSELKPWLQQQDAHTLQRTVRKRFPRNPYTISNFLDFWEAEFVDVQSLAKHNDNHKNILTVIDVFSKLLHIVPLKLKLVKLLAKRLKRF